MTPKTWISGVIILFLSLSTSNDAQRFEDLPEDQDDSIMWENIAPMVDNSRFPLLSDQELAVLLERSRPEFEQPKLEFPKLTKQQQQFGVNPAYQPPPPADPAEKTAANVAKKDTSADSGNEEETVFDPFSEDASDKNKKATMAAGGGRDSAIAQAALEQERINDIYFTTIVAVSSALVAFAVVGAGICYHRYQKNAKAAEDVEYPAYGVTGNARDISPTSADRKLAQNAQLYHYQHQKQQMMAFDSSNGNGHRGNGGISDNESDDDAEEGDYTVYECPGLAPTGEMEVRNPLFDDDSTTPKAGSDPKPRN